MAFAIKPSNRAESSDNIWALTWQGKNTLTGSIEGTVKLWSTAEKVEQKSISSSHPTGVVSLAAMRDGTRAIASYQDGTIKILSLPSLEETSRIEAGLTEVWSICLSPSDDVLVSGTGKGSVNIWSMQGTNEKLATLETHNKFILSLAFNCEAKLVTASIDGFLNVFDMSTQQVVHKIEAHALPVRSVTFSPDGNLIYSASDDRHVSIYDTISGQVVNTFSQSGMSLSVDASPDERHFAVGCADHSVSIWDLGMQRRLNSFQSHTDHVWSVRFDPLDKAGKRMASVGDDGLLQLYE